MGEPINHSRKISFKSNRRFGVELEILAFDGKNRPAGGEKDKPVGTDYVVALVKNNADENVEWRIYEHTNNNDCWVVKPDSSCGLEICSPVYRNWRGIRKVCHVVEGFGSDSKIAVDERCSVHVHVDVSNLPEEKVAAILAYWVKSEAVFLDMVPDNRKVNRYCQFICAKDMFDTQDNISPYEMIQIMGDVKYYTCNTHQWVKSNGKRKTLEFRIIEGEGCKDPFLVKNWLRLILHFVEMASMLPFPEPYKKGDPWSWLCMLDLSDVFKILGFYPGQYELSRGLTQTRNWMLGRLHKYMPSTYGPRWRSYQDLSDITNLLKREVVDFDVHSSVKPVNLTEALYSDDCRF